MKVLIIRLFCSFLLFACDPSDSAVYIEKFDNQIMPDTTEEISIDTLVMLDIQPIADPLSATPFVEDSNGLTDLGENIGLQNYVNYLHQQMDAVKSRIQLVFEGVDFGDYFHISFFGVGDEYYDFGDGNNDFGQYELYDPESFEDNSKYVGKTFEVYWEFRKSSFYCCEGQMESVTTEVPSIIKLKLLD